MANKQEKKEKQIFYVFNSDNELRKLDCSFYSPFNLAVFNPRDPKHDTYENPVMWTFKKWVFETDDENAIEYFTFLATGTSPKTGDDTLSNGKRYNSDPVNRIRMEKPKPKTEIKTITETVEVQVIPRSIVEWDFMTIEMLTDFCKSWNVKLPEMKDGNIKERIIQELEATGHIK